jgi:hypothetical protein
MPDEPPGGFWWLSAKPLIWRVGGSLKASFNMLNSVAVLWISVDSSVNRRRNPVVDQAEGLLFSS